MSRSLQRASQRRRPGQHAPKRMVVPVQEIEAIVENSGARPLTEAEQATLKAAVAPWRGSPPNSKRRKRRWPGYGGFFSARRASARPMCLAKGRRAKRRQPTRRPIPRRQATTRKPPTRLLRTPHPRNPREQSPRRSAQGTAGTGPPIIHERLVLPSPMQPYGTAIRVRSSIVAGGCMGNESPR